MKLVLLGYAVLNTYVIPICTVVGLPKVDEDNSSNIFRGSTGGQVFEYISVKLMHAKQRSLLVLREIEILFSCSEQA